MKIEKQKKHLRGGVIIIGSLFWETEKNCIREKRSKELAVMREQWRNDFLDIDKKTVTRVKLPIRYGRISSSRRCTYTMVFSSSCLKKNSFGLVIPYKENINFNRYSNFKRQAKKLSGVERIAEKDSRLRKNWGCIGLYINPMTKHKQKINNFWKKLKQVDIEYKKKNASDYSISKNKFPSLLNSDYILEEKVKIAAEQDFLFFTYMNPEHRNKKNLKYPSPREIADEMNRSSYFKYFLNNRANKITTFQDAKIKKLLD